MNLIVAVFAIAAVLIAVIRMNVVLRKICSQLARMFSQPASRCQFGWTQMALASVAQTSSINSTSRLSSAK